MTHMKGPPPRTPTPVSLGQQSSRLGDQAPHNPGPDQHPQPILRAAFVVAAAWPLPGAGVGSSTPEELVPAKPQLQQPFLLVLAGASEEQRGREEAVWSDKRDASPHAPFPTPFPDSSLILSLGDSSITYR